MRDLNGASVLAKLLDSLVRDPAIVPREGTTDIGRDAARQTIGALDLVRPILCLTATEDSELESSETHLEPDFTQTAPSHHSSLVEVFDGNASTRISTRGSLRSMPDRSQLIRWICESSA